MYAFLHRFGSCLLGYAWAALVAAFAITLLRTVADLTAGTVTGMELALMVPYSTGVMTLAIAATAIAPSVPAIILGELLLAAGTRRLPLFYGLAGGAIGVFLSGIGLAASLSGQVPQNEALFQIAGGICGGSAFWWVAARRRKPSKPANE